MLYKPEIVERTYSVHGQRMSGGKLRVKQAKKFRNWFCNMKREWRGILSEVNII